MEMIRGYKVWTGVPLGFMNSEDRLDHIEDIQFRPSDTILWVYPKSGTMFVGDMTLDLLKVCDGVKPHKLELFLLDMGLGIDDIQDSPEDVHRVFLTHLPWNALPKELKMGKYKMLCITRNPKDVFCSAYPFLKRMKYINDDMSIDTYLELYTSGKTLYGDYFEWHKQWLPHHNDANVLSLRYDEMKANLFGAICAIKEHLDLKVSDEQMEKVCDKNQFETKKAHARKGLQQQHLRKGKVGAWKEELTPEQISKLDSWIAKGKAGLDGFEFEDPHKSRL